MVYVSIWTQDGSGSAPGGFLRSESGLCVTATGPWLHALSSAGARGLDADLAWTQLHAVLRMKCSEYLIFFAIVTFWWISSYHNAVHVCVRVRVCACVHACVCVRWEGGTGRQSHREKGRRIGDSGSLRFGTHVLLSYDPICNEFKREEYYLGKSIPPPFFFKIGHSCRTLSILFPHHSAALSLSYGWLCAWRAHTIFLSVWISSLLADNEIANNISFFVASQMFFLCKVDTSI